jgi:phage terminase Nu1 subunit (DNA packaging protein)
MQRSELSTEVPKIRRATKGEAAEFFGISLRTLDAWIREGAPVAQAGARRIAYVLDLRAIAEWRYTARQSESDIDPERLPPSDRKQWYDGEMKRREIQVRDRELIPASEVEEVVATSYAAVSQALLSLPDNLERRAGLSADQAERAEDAIHETMNDLADRLAQFAPEVIE